MRDAVAASVTANDRTPTDTMLIDISPPITPAIGVWPGDVPFSREVALAIPNGDTITLSAITTTLHVGAHADGPNHYRDDTEGIGERALERYYGSCQVIHVDVARNTRVLPSDVTVPIEAPRVLFGTGTFPDPTDFNEDFAALSPELIAWLHDHGVTLCGIDTPSIDPCASKALESHQAVADRDMAILEGLRLEHVASGRYTLIALPLRIPGADASPVRAALAPAFEEP